MATTTASPVIRLSALVLVIAASFFSPASSSGAPLGKRYRVGGPDGWRVPPPEEKEMYYIKWASPITFFVEDSIEFVYSNDTVIKVSKAGYYHCNETVGIGTGPETKDGSTLFLLDAPGFAYFASADLGHCDQGQRLIINVLAAEPPSAPSAPSPAGAPSSSSSSSSTQPASFFSPSPGPAPVMEYESDAGVSLVPSVAAAVLITAACTLVLAAGLI